MALRAILVLSVYGGGVRGALVDERGGFGTTTASSDDDKDPIAAVHMAIAAFREQPARDVLVVASPSLMPAQVVSASVAGDVESLRERFLACDDPIFAVSDGRDGSRLVAMMDKKRVQGLVEVVERSGRRLRAIIPTAAALEASPDFSRASWLDGRALVSVERAQGWPVGRRCRPGVQSEPSIRTEWPNTWSDVAGAIAAWKRGGPAIDPQHIGSARTRATPLRLLALALFAAGLLAAPVVTRSMRVRHYEEQLALRQQWQRTLAVQQRALARAEAELHLIAAFQLRVTPLARLAEIATDLPADVHAISVELDSARVQVAVRGRDVGRVTSRLASRSWCREARFTGPISQDTPSDSTTDSIQRGTIDCPPLGAAASP
ncbi:MAG: hypothetical protein IT361_06050 [Gemmatimonadaceae bacterium]|nr:hypothetical protein [Gemmatimonadaceae bacterium]